MRIVKFLVTGVVGLFVNLGSESLLVALTVPYLLSSMIAFSIAMVVGFVLQKYWTFAATHVTETHRQFALYATISVANLGLNTLIVFFLVGHFAVHYLVAQGIGAAVVAIESYLLYRAFVFKAAGVADSPE